MLAGGATRIPELRREVEEHFGRSSRGGVAPELATVTGAALQGEILTQPILCCL